MLAREKKRAVLSFHNAYTIDSDQLIEFKLEKVETFDTEKFKESMKESNCFDMRHARIIIIITIM